jgi:lysophospholipase L1-like esterase
MMRSVVALVCAAFFLCAAAPEYVAVGSSFAAGPGIGVRAAGSVVRCLQSASNYPHLLARKRGWTLEDRTCSGATTQDVLMGGQGGLPAQIDAVAPGTRLVTVTVGGNDVFYMRNLWAWSCDGAPGVVGTFLRLRVCNAAPPDRVEAAFAGLEAQLREIVRQARVRAPGVRVIFVDYVTVLPEHGMCARAPMNAAQYDMARAVARRLLEMTHKVAVETHAGLVRASELTRGHDVCSADPWLTGFAFTRGVDGFGTLPYHPTQASMDAVARALDGVLGAS